MADYWEGSGIIDWGDEDGVGKVARVLVLGDFVLEALYSSFSKKFIFFSGIQSQQYGSLALSLRKLKILA